jgi:hypothetical protein
MGRDKEEDEVDGGRLKTSGINEYSDGWVMRSLGRKSLRLIA